MDIQLFSNSEFGEIRTSELDGKVLFCGTDIARALGYAKPNNAINSHCKGTPIQGTLATPGGSQSARFIVEGDVYRLIVGSKLPNAEKFETWVFEEVLPSIRKHGGYVAGQESLTDEELIARAVLVAQSKLNERDEMIALQNQHINRIEPKAKAFDAFTLGENDMDFNTFSKILQQAGIKTGHVRFMEQLRKDGYLMRNSQGDNVPTQRAKDLKIFSMKLTTITHADQTQVTRTTTRITPKGQKYLMERYAKESA